MARRNTTIDNFFTQGLKYFQMKQDTLHLAEKQQHIVKKYAIPARTRRHNEKY